jgi:transposase
VTVRAEAAADAPLRDVLATALEANERLARLAGELRTENARLAEELVRRDARIEELSAGLAVLQRLVFGGSSERARPDAPGGTGTTAGNRAGGGTDGRPRGPGARAGRRDYSHLPRVEVVWDFEDGACPLPQWDSPAS